MDNPDQSGDDVALRRLEDRVRVLTETLRAFAEATSDHDRLLDTIASNLARVLGDTCTLRVLSDDGARLELASVEARDPDVARRIREHPGAALSLDEHAHMAAVLRGGDAVVRAVEPTLPQEDASRDSRDLMASIGLHSALLVPLRLYGRSVGLLALGRLGDSPAFDEGDRELAVALADQAALALANARLLRDARRELQQRRRAESRFASLASVGILGVLIADLDGRVIEVNDALLTIIGRSRDALGAGRFDWRALTPPEWRGADDLALEQLRCMGVTGLREKELLRPDGSRVPVMMGTAMLEGAGGETISFVLNLTERKHAEREAAALREARAADEVRFRLAAIVDSSDDAIIAESLDGVIETWNHGAERMFGYTAAEAIGRPLSMLEPTDGAAPADERFAGLRFGHHEARRRRRDGAIIDVSMTLSPVRDAAGVVIGGSKVMRDVTERRRAEEAVARAREAAELANRELEAFSYSVAHDLRAPLRGMSGFANVLLEDYGASLDAEGQDCLHEIQSNAAKMGALIDALLSLSRVTRTELRPTPVDLTALARAVAASLAAADRGRRVELVVQDGLAAAVDGTLARALLENLLGNAWKFTAHATLPRVEFGGAMEGAQRVFFVRDNGAGFDMDHAPRLFGAFQRLHGAHEFPGTGIGLATVQRIVRRHGGRVWAEGRVGGGATFYFTLQPPDNR
ncbi:MAG: PAS domain S-box protein [Deltaproteobacteria bacterium]|nr:PAS domain S-box protein [Myxococcales bacterium]MDP3215394.1 PAS domain S-box protein [Deltaproteobacteria bacterium]